MDKQRYWQYVPDEVVNTGNRLCITDGFIIDFDKSGVDFGLLRDKFRPMKKPYAHRNLYKRLRRCDCQEYLLEEGRQTYDAYYEEYDGLFLYSLSSGGLVQKKYLDYFRRLYSNCQFYYNPRSNFYALAVKVNGKIIGGIAGVSRLASFISIKRLAHDNKTVEGEDG